MNKICANCNKEGEFSLKSEPVRHLLSPNSFNVFGDNKSEKYYNYFCSKECMDLRNNETYAYWAELDRNASDSECFEHIGWRKIGSTNHRIGKCKINNKEIIVQPLMIGNNSGQPIECFENFELKHKYREFLYK